MKKYKPYIATTKENLGKLKVDPLGMETYFVDIDEPKNKDFLELLNKLDGMAYGPKGIPIEKWVAYDMGMLPSAIVGFYVESEKACQKIKKTFKTNESLIPVSEYCGIPSVDNEVWIGHTLGHWQGNDCKIDKGLGTLTKTVAMGIYPLKFIAGIAQYDNISIKVHAKFSDLEIVSALAPAHSLPDMTFHYKSEIPETEGLIKILSEESKKEEHAIEKSSFLLDPSDMNKKKEMQKNILEGKKKYFILQPGLVSFEDKLKLPILEI